jgi:hypothetical protein
MPHSAFPAALEMLLDHIEMQLRRVGRDAGGVGRPAVAVTSI